MYELKRARGIANHIQELLIVVQNPFGVNLTLEAAKIKIL